VEAQKWLHKAASQGIISAQVMVARIDRQPPKGLTPDLAASLAGLRAAAARNDAPALALLADYTARGMGQSEDAAQAQRLRQRASELGDPSATWAIVAEMSGKEASPEQLHRGFEMLVPCAESGDQRCQYELAMRYIQGRGTPADKTQFFKWMKVVANNGNSTAEAHLGQTLMFDTGPDRDVKAGIGYLREAASHGNPVGLGRLADQYRTGEHIPQDLAKSWALYKLAAQRGDDESRGILDQMRPQLSPAQIDKGDQLARAWTPDRRAPGAWDWRALAVGPRDSANSF
jgi:TPR repeat protein